MSFAVPSPSEPRLFHRPYLRYNAKQLAFWQDAHRFIIAACGRRSGKTEIAIVRCLRAAVEPKPWDDPRYCLAAPTYGQAHLIFWERLKGYTPKWMMDGDPRESNMSLRLINNAEIRVVGMDKPQRIEGVGWDGFVLDEFADMKPQAWSENVRPALADRRGWAIVIGVPNGRNHFFEMFQHAKQQPDRWGWHTWHSGEVLPQEEIDDLRASSDERTFRQEVMASFEEATGRMYYAFDQTLDVHEFALPQQIGEDGLPWRGGMDFNVDPMTSCWGWEQRTGRTVDVFVWDEAYIRTSSTYELAKYVRDRATTDRRFGEFEMHPDPTGQARHSSAGTATDFTILRESGFKVLARSGSPARRDRINSVNAMFCNGLKQRRVHIHPRCKNLIRCLEGAIYKDGTNEIDSQKCQDMDHITDAFGYWIEFRHRVAAGNAFEAFEPRQMFNGGTMQ